MTARFIYSEAMPSVPHVKLNSVSSVRGALRLPGRQAESLMDGNAFDVVSPIKGRHIDYVEGGSVWRNLNVQHPAAAGAAGQASDTTAVGIQGLDGERVAAAGAIAASRGVIGSSRVGRRTVAVQGERPQRSSKATTSLADGGHLPGSC